jgi:hypothetical protein
MKAKRRGRDETAQLNQAGRSLLKSVLLVVRWRRLHDGASSVGGHTAPRTRIQFNRVPHRIDSDKAEVSGTSPA